MPIATGPSCRATAASSPNRPLSSWQETDQNGHIAAADAGQNTYQRPVLGRPRPASRRHPVLAADAGLGLLPVSARATDTGRRSGLARDLRPGNAVLLYRGPSSGRPALRRRGSTTAGDRGMGRGPAVFHRDVEPEDLSVGGVLRLPRTRRTMLRYEPARGGSGMVRHAASESTHTRNGGRDVSDFLEPEVRTARTISGTAKCPQLEHTRIVSLIFVNLGGRVSRWHQWRPMTRVSRTARSRLYAESGRRADL